MGFVVNGRAPQQGFPQSRPQFQFHQFDVQNGNFQQRTTQFDSNGNQFQQPGFSNQRNPNQFQQQQQQQRPTNQFRETSQPTFQQQRFQSTSQFQQRRFPDSTLQFQQRNPDPTPPIQITISQRFIPEPTSPQRQQQQQQDNFAIQQQQQQANFATQQQQANFATQQQPVLPATAPPPQTRASMTESCLACICQASTSCNLTTPCVSQGQYCGPFLLSKPYWLDAGRPILFGDSADRDGGIKYFHSK